MKDAQEIDTRITNAGRKPWAFDGFVNPPVFHASTVLSRTVKDLLAQSQPYIYGRRGTPTSHALEEAMAELEGGDGAVLCPSGLSACTLALLSCLKPGDNLLMSDSVYGPVRHFCDGVLLRMGITTTYYRAMSHEVVAALIRPETRALYIEAPSSYSFEVPDIQAIVSAARARDLTVLADNSWATPLFFRPHEHGIDISIQAATKYVAGHSDVMLGIVSAIGNSWPALKSLHGDLGLCAGPDDIYLALRGLRTLGVRLRQHERNALEIARWLIDSPAVRAVLHPAIEGSVGHGNWLKNFDGSSGLFSIVLTPASDGAIGAFLDGLTVFGLGYSWGGFESLAVPYIARHNQPKFQDAWGQSSPCVRLHIGLEDTRDLILDLDEGLNRYINAANNRESSC